MNYEERLGLFVDNNWSMGKNEVVKGACSWGESADDENSDLKEENLELKDKVRQYEQKVQPADLSGARKHSMLEAGCP